jgi:hypothetical protein
VANAGSSPGGPPPWAPEQGPSGWKLAGSLVPLAYIGWSLWLLALGIGLLVTA